MTTHTRKYRPCDRCGRVRQVQPYRVNICRDCKEADPAYVKAVKEGRKIA